MRVRVSALWDQVASRLGPGNVDAEAVQRAVLRAAGYAWCVPLPRTRVACLASRSRHETRADAPSPPRRSPSPSPFRRDDVTGELTDWPRDVVVSPGPEARPSASPTRGAACAPVDLTSPDDAARRDDDDDDAAREPRGDATPRDGPDKTSALLGIKGVKTNAERAESPVVSIAISDSEDGEDADDATRKRGRGDRDDVDDVADVAASRRAREDSGSPSRPPPRAPSFARASSAQLERELAKHGMKPGPREYMTRELARAWAAGAALPPDFFEPEAETSRPNPKPRPSDTRGHAGGRSDSADGALEDALGRFIKSNVALYERVLLMETVDVDEVLATVRRAPAPLAPGVAVAKVPRAKLLAYLEREGVAVTHTSGRRARATRTRF